MIKSRKVKSKILHVVGPVTDEVFSFLGPTTRVLNNAGHAQIIIAIDELKHTKNLTQLENHGQLLRISTDEAAYKKWRRVMSCCLEMFSKETIETVHVHGFIPYTVVALSMKRAKYKASVIYSPHGSRSNALFRIIGASVLQFVIPIFRSDKISIIVNVPNEVNTGSAKASSELIESPVDERYFKVVKFENKKPLIITGASQKSVRSAEVFSQLAVLLSGQELGLEFIWLGYFEELAKDRLDAAGVQVLIDLDEERVAELFSSGWMYVAPWWTRGFPLFLAQAMAAGLPCVALDCPQNRAVIINGETGFLCSSESEMVERIADLVDNAELRLEIGIAARANALQRYSSKIFDRKLLTLYPGLLNGNEKNDN